VLELTLKSPARAEISELHLKRVFWERRVWHDDYHDIALEGEKALRAKGIGMENLHGLLEQKDDTQLLSFCLHWCVQFREDVAPV
jgi:hypothetical protein